MKPALQEIDGAGTRKATQRSGPLTRWLATLYDAHRASLCAHLRRKYGEGPPEPEDVVQQAFARIAKLDWPLLQAITHPKAFLFRTAEHVLIDEKRREITRRRHAIETRAGIFIDHGCDLNPENVLVKRDELALIERTIRAMPERRRVCFLMHRMDELSCAEIARRLGISGTAVRGHVERALADIEAAVDEHNGETS